MEYRRNIQRDNESPRKRGRKRYRLSGPVKCFLVGIAGIVSVVALMFGTSVFTNPEIEMISSDFVVSQHDKEQIIAYSENSRREPTETKTDSGNKITTGSSTYGGWENLSGYYWGDYPIELYFLSTIGERGSSEASILACKGDAGQAYGLMQLDYRYDLVPFMREAYAADPVAWAGFQPYLGLEPKDSTLVNNQGIVDAFNYCYTNYPDVYMKIQPNFFAKKYYFENTDVLSRLENAGIDLSQHNIIVTAALISCNINCGSITGTNNFIKAGARNDMTDEELLNCVYTGWRMYRTNPKWSAHGARLATDKSGEEGVALQYLRGEIDIAIFDNSKTCSYGAGWDGPNSVRLAQGGSGE